jgi:hypothetical protein
MATDIQNQINDVKAKMAKAPRGSDRYKKLLRQFNSLREQAGRDPLSGKEAAGKLKKPSGNTQPQGGYNVPKGGLKNAPNVLETEIGIQDYISDQNVQLGSPGIQKNPFGTQTIERDENGNIVVDSQLSDPQQQILDRDQALSIGGRDAAQQLLEGQNFGADRRALGSDFQADRARMEEEVYGRLTRGMDEDRAQGVQEIEQRLHGRGIPMGSKQWNDEMQRFDRQFQERELDARAQATMMGGQEYERNFGIQEQTLGNQMNEAGYMSQFGTGLQLPNFQGYQGVQMQAPSALGVATGMGGLDLQREQLEFQKQQYADKNQGGSGGGGGGGAPKPNNPFNNTLPPSAPRPPSVPRSSPVSEMRQQPMPQQNRRPAPSVPRSSPVSEMRQQPMPQQNRRPARGGKRRQAQGY